MSVKRCAVLLLSAMLLMLCAVPAAANDDADAPSFSDTEGHWAEAAIERWSGMEVIVGYQGKFRPDDPITRAEMAIIVNKIICYADIAENPFSDLEDGQWFTDAVLKCNAAGVMSGDAGRGTVRPKDNITRAEAMSMLARALGLSYADAACELPYIDADQVPDWANDVVCMMYSGGYLTDSTLRVRARDAITRAEVVNLLNELIATLYSSKGINYVREAGNVVITGESAVILNSHITGNLIIVGSLPKTVVLSNTTVDGEVINKSGAVISDSMGKSIPSSLGDFDTQNVRLNKYASEGFFTDRRGRVQYMYNGVTAFTGIDVSEHNENIDWERVAADGIDFAIIRVGWRGYTEGVLHEDIYWEENLRGAKAAGLKVGVYLYAQAVSVEEALEEAEYTLDLIDGYQLDLPVVYDWEYAGASDARTNDIADDTLTDCFAAYCSTIERSGYDAMIYFSTTMAYSHLDMKKLSPYYSWYASYNSNEVPEFYYYFDIWQYSDAGQVDGISTKVDMDLCFVNF